METNKLKTLVNEILVRSMQITEVKNGSKTNKVYHAHTRKGFFAAESYGLLFEKVMVEFSGPENPLFYSKKSSAV